MVIYAGHDTGKCLSVYDGADGSKDLEADFVSWSSGGYRLNVSTATGVTGGEFLKGVRFTGDGARTHSVVMRSRSGTIRFIETVHRFTRNPNYGW